jgi:hypothetical protein
MVVCLGGLAGAGAVVCCDLDEGLEPVEAAPESEIEDDSEELEPDRAKTEPSSVH